MLHFATYIFLAFWYFNCSLILCYIATYIFSQLETARLDESARQKAYNQIQNISGVIAKFYCNQENGWPETAKLFKQLYATELKPLFISPHYLQNLFSVPDKVVASAVKYIFEERREVW